MGRGGGGPGEGHGHGIWDMDYVSLCLGGCYGYVSWTSVFENRFLWVPCGPMTRACHTAAVPRSTVDCPVLLPGGGLARSSWAGCVERPMSAGAVPQNTPRRRHESFDAHALRSKHTPRGERSAPSNHLDVRRPDHRASMHGHLISQIDMGLPFNRPVRGHLISQKPRPWPPHIQDRGATSASGLPTESPSLPAHDPCTCPFLGLSTALAAPSRPMRPHLRCAHGPGPSFCLTSATPTPSSLPAGGRGALRRGPRTAGGRRART